MPVSASSLPREIIEVVVDFMQGEALFSRERGVPKKQISAWSLTCYHWALCIRHHLFRHLRIRSESDTNSLLDFVKSTILDSPMRIVSYVETLDLIVAQDEADGAPWLHHIFLNRHLLPRRHTINVVLDGSGKGSFFRPLLDRLPRAVPHSLSQCESITVQNAHFPRFEDLLALAQRTKHRELTCNKVSWETPSTPMDLLPRLRNTRFIAHSATTTSFDDASQMLLLMTAIRPGNDGVIRRISSRSQCSWLIADQLVKLQELVRSVTACSFNRSGDTERCSFYFTVTQGDVATVLLAGDPPDIDRSIEMEIVACPCGVIITIQAKDFLRNCNDLGSLPEYPWAALDEHIPTFEYLRSLEMELPRSGFNSVRACEIMDIIESKLPRMGISRKLSYWRWHLNNLGYLRVPVTRPTSGTDTRQNAEVATHPVWCRA